MSLTVLIGLGACWFFVTPAQEDKKADYFPMQVGNQWEYKDSAGQIVIVEVTGKKKLDSKETNEGFVFAVKDRTGTTNLTYGLTKEGIKLFERSVTSGGKTYGSDIETPRLLIKYPLKRGDQWDYGKYGEPSGEGFYRVQNLGQKKTQVSAGAYDCFKIKMVWTASGMVPNVAPTEATRTLYLAEGMGIVKEEMSNIGGVRGPTSVVRELVKYEKAGAKKSAK
jgi:hypothetical protein